MITNSTKAFALALAFVVTSACGGSVRYALLGGRDHSTTEGEARFEARDEGGYTVEVAMDRLPTAERLEVTTAHFFVWSRAHGATTSTKVAELVVDPATRSGRATGVVPSTNIELLITAEASADVTEPSSTVIVHTVLEGQR